MEANQYLNDFYNHYDEDSRLLFPHGSVEFLTTMRYIEKYLKHGDKVLEIGAGTGRYSHALARRGHPVDAVELVAHNIEVFRQNTRPGESVTIAQGNALDLSAFADNAYDVTLLLGPLYHLYTQDDKRRALRQLPFIGGVFEREPREVVEHRLPYIARPRGKQPRGHVVAEPLVHIADDAVHIEIRRAVRAQSEKARLKAVIRRSRPDEVDGAALLLAVLLCQHRRALSP